MEKLLSYLNPIAQLGKPKRSFLYPLLVNIAICILSEIYTYNIAKDPLAVGGYIIFLNVAFIIYFSFRDGLLGGFTSVVITLLYYAYIMYTRHYTGKILTAGIDATISLGLVYSLLAGIIGFLKNTIDKFIEREANARSRLEAILDQLPTGIIISSPQGDIEFINKHTQKLFGKEVQKGIQIGNNTGHTSLQDGILVKVKDSPSVHVLTTGKKSKEKSFTFSYENGEKMYVTSHASPIKNKKGKIIAVASISHDVTAQRIQEQRKDDFINMTSHELKTPLTSVKVFTQVLQRKLEKTNDKEAIHIADRINTQLNKLTMLVGDLLDVTRMEKGKLKVVKEKFLVHELVSEIVEDLQLISEHTLVLHWTTKSYVFGDKERIRQVLTNLVTNAVKYSPGDEKIIIGSRKNKDMLEIYVQDFGIGIVDSEKRKIFERFYQVGEDSTYPGLGLGLYISSQIIKQHKGKMWVESEKEKGSTFWFSLPIYRSQ